MKKNSDQLGSTLDEELNAIRDHKTGSTNLRSKELVSGWLSTESLPQKDGTEAILWLTTDKGFPDVSAHCFLKNGSWYWMDTHEVIKRQDFIMGWQPWPEPPITYSLVQDEN